MKNLQIRTTLFLPNPATGGTTSVAQRNNNKKTSLPH
jgi:hypothetical protein